MALSLLAASLQVAARVLRRGPKSNSPSPDAAPDQPPPTAARSRPSRDDILFWLAVVSTLATLIAAIASVVSLLHG